MAVLVWVLLVWVSAAPAWGQAGEADGGVLTVQGSGEVAVAPDFATVRVGIVEQAASARDAQERVNGVATEILAALDGLGLENRQVQTSRLVLSPVYSQGRPEPGETPRIVAYRASNTVSVRIEELERIGPAIDAALDSGGNQLEGVFFGLQDDRQAREEALRAAVENARGKAEAMADALDIDLEGLVSVTEGGVVSQPQFEGVRALAAQEASATPVSPGEIRVTASVVLEYRIAAPR